jgi:PAS domain S-box-containing protein
MTASRRAFPDAASRVLEPLAGRLGDTTLLITLHDHREGELVVFAVADGAGLDLQPGQRMPLETTLCSSMAADLAPQLCNDVAADPVYRTVATGADVRSYVGLPLELIDGTRVGSVCALGRDTDRFDADDHAALSQAACALSGALQSSSDEAAASLAPARDDRRRRVSARVVVPFAATLALAFAMTVVVPTAGRDVAMILVAALLGAAILGSVAVLPWGALPPYARMLPAYACLVVVALLRDAEGGAESGLAVLVLVPVLWTSLYGTRGELLVAVAGATLTVVLPHVLIGGTAYPGVELRRGIVTAGVGLVLGVAIQRVVRLAETRAGEVRDRVRELRAAEEEKRLILATAGEGIIGLDADASATFVNPAAASLTGFSAGELVGRPFADLASPAQVRAVLRDGQTRRVESSFRRRAGVPFSADCTVRALWRGGVIAGAVVTFNDTSERRRAERELQDEREFLRALLESLDEGIVACGPDGELRLHNDATTEMLGDDASAFAAAPLSRAFRGERIREAEVVSGADGVESRTVQVNGQPVFDGEGRRLGAVLALHDVTERRRAERLKDEFFALVSHELRTPLTSIVGYLEILREDAEEDDALSEDHRRHLDVLDRNARRLQRLVGDLLFVAQLEAGRLTLEPGTVDVAARAGDAVEAVGPRARECGVAIELDVRPLASCAGDGERIGQVLDNLLANAVKFTPAGGRVVVRTRQEGDTAIIEVADTGVGIPAGDMDRLFERFFRAGTATEQQIPGIGLGLAITRAIVRAHGGDIDVASVEGYGTTFRVELPLAGVPAGAPAVPVAA